MSTSTPAPTLSARIRAHLSIARFDHWTKNVFVLPGIVVPLGVTSVAIDQAFFWRVLWGMLATGFIASSNYIINEVLDAPYDRLHPIKKERPAASGLVNIPLAYVQWIVFLGIGMFFAWQLHTWPFTVTMGILWIMGCLYNIPPIRTKDVQYLDVLSESVNNPLRMLAGWFMVTTVLFPPASLLISYWMMGCYLMALKRFSEFRQIGDQARAGSYRKSFRHYTERSLLVSVVFYGSAATMFFGAFIVRYRLELALSFPLVALVMAIYFHMSFDENSAAQNPESLHKHRGLMASVVACAVVMTVLLFVDIPLLRDSLEPTMPTAPMPASRR